MIYEPGLTKGWRGLDGERIFTFHEGGSGPLVFFIETSRWFKPVFFYIAFRIGSRWFRFSKGGYS